MGTNWSSPAGTGALADAIGFMEKRKLGEVPSLVNDWRARRDSNPRPLASEANTLIR